MSSFELEAAPANPSLVATSSIKTSDKSDVDFRNYDPAVTPRRVVEHYLNMRSKHTVAQYEKMAAKYHFDPVTGEGRRQMTILEAFKELECYVDASDPDLDLPNLVHLLQTAEGIRKAGHPEWFQVVGLLHDMGKIMFLWGDDSDGQNGYDPKGQQWGLGGDTFVVGCALPEGAAIVFPEFNHLNPDMADDRYSSTFGMYAAKCGIDNLKFAWGHDEYMYRMLVANKADIPKEGLAMVRYHSAYPWHTHNQYSHLTTEEDEEIKEWVKVFNQFDLYTKDGNNKVDVDALWPYYKGLLDKFGLGGKLWW